MTQRAAYRTAISFKPQRNRRRTQLGVRLWCRSSSGRRAVESQSNRIVVVTTVLEMWVLYCLGSTLGERMLRTLPWGAVFVRFLLVAGSSCSFVIHLLCIQLVFANPDIRYPDIRISGFIPLILWQPKIRISWSENSAVSAVCKNCVNCACGIVAVF